MPKAMGRRACGGCGRQFALETRSLKVCGRCRHDMIRYCSVHCQWVCWDAHKRVCSHYRGFRFRKCVVCGREAEEELLPGCDCGRRCYCGEACQAEDWAAGTAFSRPHSETCASGYLYLDLRLSNEAAQPVRDPQPESSVDAALGNAFTSRGRINLEGP